MPASVERVVIVVQENHTTDNYLRGLAPWGANVRTNVPPETNPPSHNPAHARRDYFNWLHHKGSHPANPFDTAQVLPYYLWLAVHESFLENHCAGYATTFTPNHLLIVGSQTPTLGNPPAGPNPVRDLPSLPGLAGDHGISWLGYTWVANYPVAFYQQLQGSPDIVEQAMAGGDTETFQLMWSNRVDGPEGEPSR